MPKTAARTKLTAEQQELAARNVKLAYHQARHYKVDGLDDDERESAALYGLCLAAKDFDESRGNSFATFAVVTIRRWMVRSANLNRTIHIPVHIQYGVGAGRKPPRREYVEAAERARRVSAMPSQWAGAADASPWEAAAGVEEQERLSAAIDALPEKQREAILDRLAGLSLTQVAAKHRVSRQAIQNRTIDAISNLRAAMA